MPKATAKKLASQAIHSVEKNTEYKTKAPIESVMFSQNMSIRSKADATTLSQASLARFDIYDYGDRIVLEPKMAAASRCVLFPSAIAYISLKKG